MTEEQKQLGLKDILAKVAKTPNLRFDPATISAYQGLGGALTNGGIPGPNVQATPIGIATSQGGIKAINDIKNQTQGMQPPPKPATEPTPKPEKTTEDKIAEQLANEGLTDFDKQRLELEQRAIKRTQETKDFITSLSSQLDASKASMLQGIGEQYNRIIQQTEEANRRYEAVVQTAGIRSGGAKYSPEITGGIYQAAVNEGLQRVADIISKRNEAIASVNSAYDSKKFTLMAEQFDRLNKINDDLDATLKDIAKEQRKKTEELNVEIKKRNDEISIYNAIQEIGSSDPFAIFSKLKGKVGAEDIKKFLENITPEISKDTTSNAYKFSNDDAGFFISKGLGSGQDIQLLQDVLNESGLYKKSEKLGGKSLSETLTPEELAAVKERLYTPPKTVETIYDESYIAPEWKSLVDTTGNLYSTKSIGDEVKKSIISDIKAENYGNAYAQVANAVEEKLTGEVKTKFANSRTDYLIMQNFAESIQEYADAGGDMGLLTGKEEEIKRKLGIDSGKATELAVELWREFQTYRLNMTGAAFSEAESRDYASVNPSLGKSLNLNLSKIGRA